MNLCAGLQRRFTIGRQSPLYNAPIGGAYSVYALNTLNAGNTAEAAAQTGKGAFQPGQFYFNTIVDTEFIIKWKQKLC